MCDAIGANPLTSQGLRQVLRFGSLWGGVLCGAFAAYLGFDLAYRWWNIGGRISGQSCQHDHYATTTLHASQ